MPRPALHLLPHTGEGVPALRAEPVADGRLSALSGRAGVRVRSPFSARPSASGCGSASLTYGADMRAGLARRAALARAIGAPLMATNDALMHAPERRPLADVLACIREKTTLRSRGAPDAANAERHLKAAGEMARLFAAAPEAVAETIRFLDGLTFSLDELGTIATRKSCARATPRRRRRSKPSRRAARARAIPAAFRERSREALAHELALIAHARLRALFSHRPRHRALRPHARNPVPGPRLGGQFRGLLLPRHHRGRPGAIRSSLRALHLARAQRAAGHRRRFRARAARGGDPVHLRALRARARRPRRRRDRPIAPARRSASRPRFSASATTSSPRSTEPPGATTRRRSARTACARRALIPPIRRWRWRWGWPRELTGFPRHLSPAHRRLRHHPRPARRGRAGDERGDGRSHHDRMGQGRSRRAGHPQGRRARARHADRALPRASTFSIAITASA